MYVPRWSRDPRQGDIFGTYPYPKLKNLPQITERPQGWQGEGGTATVLEYPAEYQYAVLISHCCEFREGKRERFLIARIQSFPPRMSDEMRAQVEASNAAVQIEEPEAATEFATPGDGEKPEPKERYEYLELFVLDPLPGCFADKMLVDFSTIMSIHKGMIPYLKSDKKAEFEQEDREQFRKKLGMFLARDAGDVKEDRRVDPWWTPEVEGDGGDVAAPDSSGG
jgi:hypothetical protein